MRTVLAIGAHIGDAELTSGPLLAQTVLDGGVAVIVALTPGERGHPALAPDVYRRQKIAEGNAFAERIGAEFIVFDDIEDGFLVDGPALASRLASVIRSHAPALVTGHWTGSWHPDHVAAAHLTIKANFLTTVVGPNGEPPASPAPRLAHAENWEDMDGFKANRFVAIQAPAFERWSSAISLHSFTREGFSGFRYIDYYTSLMTTRGCLAGVERACALMVTSDALQPLDF
jgi:LmbE family N-acetylglucosaminyl deacetylase